MISKLWNSLIKRVRALLAGPPAVDKAEDVQLAYAHALLAEAERNHLEALSKLAEPAVPAVSEPPAPGRFEKFQTTTLLQEQLRELDRVFPYKMIEQIAIFTEEDIKDICSKFVASFSTVSVYVQDKETPTSFAVRVRDQEISVSSINAGLVSNALVEVHHFVMVCKDLITQDGQFFYIGFANSFTKSILEGYVTRPSNEAIAIQLAKFYVDTMRPQAERRYAIDTHRNIGRWNGGLQQICSLPVMLDTKIETRLRAPAGKEYDDAPADQNRKSNRLA